VAERRNFRGIVFDLDGTLIDSYEAIATSLNHARQAFGRPPMSIGEVRLQVGHGLESLIESWVDSEQVDRGVQLFREK
jgi:phosphoglycolate phosphatase-like HAD superfamily hydrolase